MDILSQRSVSDTSAGLARITRNKRLCLILADNYMMFFSRLEN